MLFLVVVLWLQGCFASPLGSPQSLRATERTDSLVMVDGLVLPHVDGVAGCGAQALACVLNHANRASFPDAVDLAADLPWHDRGATPVELLLEARRRGGAAAVYRGDRWRLRNAIHRGDAVIVMLDAGPVIRTPTDTIATTTVMHWAVVSGMRRDGSGVFLAAIDDRHHEVSRDAFFEMWRASDNCMIIVSKGE